MKIVAHIGLRGESVTLCGKRLRRRIGDPEPRSLFTCRACADAALAELNQQPHTITFGWRAAGVTQPPSAEDSAVDLIKDGLLWLINAAVFHPRGFALAVAPGGALSLLGDGSEPWRFGDDAMVDAKFKAAEAALERARNRAQESGS